MQAPRDVRQEAGVVAAGQGTGCIRDSVEEIIQPFSLGFGEVVQHIMRDRILGAWVADTKANARILVANVSRN